MNVQYTKSVLQIAPVFAFVLLWNGQFSTEVF